MPTAEEEIAEIQKLREIEEIKNLRQRQSGVLNERRTVPAVEAAIAGAGQGLSFGFSDEAIAGAKAGYKALTSDAKFGDEYSKEKKQQQAYLQAARADNPGAYMAGELGGTVGSAFIPGLNALAPAKGASIAANVGRAALGGAVTGAGLSEGSLLSNNKEEAKKLAKDIGLGAALGGGLQFGASKLGQTLEKLNPAKLKTFAEEQAVKGAGAMSKEMRELASQGKLHSLGRELLDKKVVTALASLDDVAERSGALKKEAGAKIGSVIKNADDLLSSTTKMIDEGKLFSFLPDDQRALLSHRVKEEFGFSLQNIGKALDEKLVKPNLNNPALAKEVAKVKDLAEAYLGKDAISLTEGQQFKSAQRKITKFASETVPEQFKKEVYGIIKDELDNAVGKIATLEDRLAQIDVNDVIGEKLSKENIAKLGAAIKGEFQDANKAYGTAAQVNQMANKRLGQVRSNNKFSLTDTVAAAGGFAGGGGAGAVALGALNALKRKYGTTVSAVGADKLAKVLERAPDSLGKFGQALTDAAKASPMSLLVTHRALMKNPDYQNILNNFEPEVRGLRLPNQQSGLRLPQ